MQVDNIPTEMRAYAQWVCWRYEQRDGSRKPTKVPYSPQWGNHASVTNAATWSTFENAIAVFEKGGFDGIGFVLTTDDPFGFIDLDDTSGDANAVALQTRIFNTFDSYAERSPSGNGLHIIVKGSIERGRRRGSVEVYSSLRYMTMTGNVYRDAPINDCGELLHTLWAELGGSTPSIDRGIDGQETEPDDAIIARMFRAQNGNKARQLYEGRWDQFYSSQSEADFALINIVAFYTDNCTQITRIFRNSVLGQRSKANRTDYIQPMIAKACDQRLATIDTSWIDAELERKQTASTAPFDLLPTICVSEWEGSNEPVRQWHVEGFIPHRNVTIQNGNGGSGKSLIVLQLAAATVLGRTWFDLPVRKGPALFVTAEDELDEVHRRISQIAKAEGVSLSDLQGLTVSSLADRDALLAEPAGRGGALSPTALYNALAALTAEKRPALVVIDTLADTFGGNENDRGHARSFIGLLRRIAIAFDTTVVVLAHPSREGLKTGSGDGGSTAWNNSVRSRLYLEHDQTNSNNRILSIKKANYGVQGSQVRIRWHEGAFVKIDSATSYGAHQEASQKAIDELFLKLLAEFTERGQQLSRAPSSTNFAPKFFAGHPDSGGINRRGFKSAMDRLFAQGRICDGLSDGPPSRQRRIITLPNSHSNLPSNPVPASESTTPNPTANLFEPTC